MDLHLHSTASDGEFSPDEVVRRAKAEGLEAVALTDHDTVAGLPGAREEGDRLGLRVIAGCEFSVAAPWGEMHLLGYFLPLDQPVIDRYLADRRADRLRRAEAMVARLRGLDVSIGIEDVVAAAGTGGAAGAIGRPHVARALVERGAVADVGVAFDRYLGFGRPAFEPKRLPPLSEVADLVHRFGGVVSAAHLKDRATSRNLRRLQAHGLDAVEARHPRHPPDLRARIEHLAHDLGLLVTGGSDWHGDAMAGMVHAAVGSQRVPASWLADLEAQAARYR